MKTAFRIFLRDLKRLSRNRAAALVMVGVCLLPSLYAWFNIAANMDPYGNTAGIKVAIANCDRGASADMISLNAGDTIVQSLKKNDQLGWVFVDEKKAKDGVRSGKYYAAIVIPDDFSDSLLSVRIGDEIVSIQTMLGLLNEGLSKLEAIANPNEKLKNLIRLGTFMRNSTQTGLHAKQLYVLKTRLFAETDKTKLAELLDSIEKLLRDEMQNAADTIPLVEADSRLGWEPSMHYMTDAWHLDWKMRQITSVLKFSLPEYRKSLAK